MAPPWPDRLTSLPPDDPALRNRSTGSNVPLRRIQDPSSIAGLVPLNGSPVQVDSSSSDAEYRSKRRPKRPQHGRSMSHPFPSLFSSKKKKQSRAPSGHGDSDSTDDDGPVLPQRGKSQHGDGHDNRDFATGNCMTCGSLVRWPKDLRLFKCTICLTVNDLHAPTPEGRYPARFQDAASIAVQKETMTAKHISPEHTKSLVKRCICSFLDTVLAEPTDTKGATGHSGSNLPPPVAAVARESYMKPAELPARSMRQWRRDDASPTARSSAILDGLPEPILHQNPLRRNEAIPRSLSTSFPDRRPTLHGLVSPDHPNQAASRARNSDTQSKRIFKPLEEYIISCFTSPSCLEQSFLSHGPAPSVDFRSGVSAPSRHHTEARKEQPRKKSFIPDVDAKLLLLGDFAENGSWWTGGQEDMRPSGTRSSRNEEIQSCVNVRTPQIGWSELDDWYATVINAGEMWSVLYHEMALGSRSLSVSNARLEQIEAQILLAQQHTQRVLLKATETLLKRPGRPITAANDLRFLLMILANPLLHASTKAFSGVFKYNGGGTQDPAAAGRNAARGTGPASGRHSGIIKRILGLISNSSNECHTQFVAWLSRYPEPRFAQTKDLVSGFIAYRLIRQNEKKQETKFDVTAGLIPNVSAGRSAATLHAALGQVSEASKKPKEQPKKMLYHDDWQIKAAARVLALLFAANNSGHPRRRVSNVPPGQNDSAGSQDRVHARGQILATSDFYATLLDHSDLVADFEAWEHKRGKFSFCQYPFLLSIWAKIQILEYDARRQMRNKARDAFFDSIMTHRNIDQYLVLNIRRDCLVEDSLKGVSGIIGSGGEDIKKGLRIVFKGEEGIDAGGLRKEWFLLLVREVFNPDHGMFVYDEDSGYCYFNPGSFETSDQFFLVGVVFGLAIYNSTILDVAFPPFAFRKLLMAAPAAAAGLSAHPRPAMIYTLDDLAEYRPRLARSLGQLLEYEGDVEETFCLDFVVDVDKYGSTEQAPLCPGGEKRPVTNANRRDYVDLYVRYILDTAVARQFEPFKRGFFTVCGGNALSLFRAEEIELLLRGSDEPLDIASLRLAADYDGWKCRDPGENEATVRWFWQTFEEASAKDQRKLLLFITGSDRIPAMGAASLCIRVICLGDDCGRFPTARTCFNTLALWRYNTKERLERMLWGAVHGSEGFGLK